MPLPPLPTGTRVGPESEPRHFRIARVRRLGEIVIEYEAQDTVRGDSCLILEFAPEALSTRGPDGSVLPNADAKATWAKALQEFTDQSTAMTLAKSRHVEELRTLWLAGGTAFRALKVAANAPVIPYQSDVVPGAARRSATQSSSTQIRRGPSRSASRSRPIRPVADRPGSASGPVRPTPRSRPIRPVGDPADAPSARARAAASRSRPIRPVADAASAATSPAPAEAKYEPPPLSSSAAMSSMQNELAALVGNASSTDQGPAPKLSNSDAMSSMQDELQALVMNVKVAGEMSEAEQREQRLAEESANDPGPQKRIALIAGVAVALLILLKLCSG